MDNGSRVNREVYARFCGRLEVKFLRPTRQSFWSVAVTLAGIELMHMIAKGQMKRARGTHQSIVDQLYSLAT